MAQFAPEWIAHQRERWRRHDAHLWIRPDAYRFMAPGAPAHVGKDAVPSCRPEQPSSQRPQTEAHASAAHLEYSEAIAAEIKALHDLQYELEKIKIELRHQRRLRLLRAKAGYNPDQPRVPAGSPQGGQWTSGDGGGRNDPRIISDATPINDWKPGA